MKKALVMILSLTIVGAVIAQEQAVKVSGYVNTGLQMSNLRCSGFLHII